jgi:hypothetical protein
MRNINPTQSFVDRNRADTLLEKWAPVLDYSSDSIKAIGSDQTRLNTAILLENQEQYCIQEANNSGVFGGGQQAGFTPSSPNSKDSYAAGDARLPKILIPMIRRTFPELISNDIVGVQPMSGPVGLAFALRYAYQSQNLGNGIDGSNATTGTGGNYPGNANGGTYAGYNSGSTPTGELGYQFLDTRFTGASSSSLVGRSGVWDFADQDRGVAQILSAFEITGNIPQVEVKFEKTAVEAGTSRLGARWSVELEQDLKNINGIDIDA